MALDADLVSLALPDSGAGADGASAVQRVMDKIPPKQEWLKDGPEAYVAEGDVDTAFVSARIPTVPEPGPAPEVEAQRKRVEFVRAAVESSPIAALSKLSDLLKALRTVTQARVRRAPQKAGKIRPKQIEDGAASDGAWREFEACARCLEDFGMIKDGNVTSIGKLVGAINADNALWMGVNLLYSEELQTLGPHELAAAMSCLVSESGRPDIFVGYEASPNVQSFAEQSLHMQARLLSVQLSHGVDAAIPLDITYAGLVEAWALGASWNELVAMTSMQEGDIIRVLRRVLDALRQIPRLPFVADGMGVDAEFRVNARRALTLMDRFPVSDDVTYMVDEDETLDQGLAGSLKVPPTTPGARAHARRTIAAARVLTRGLDRRRWHRGWQKSRSAALRIQRSGWAGLRMRWRDLLALRCRTKCGLHPRSTRAMMGWGHPRLDRQRCSWIARLTFWKVGTRIHLRMRRTQRPREERRVGTTTRPRRRRAGGVCRARWGQREEVTRMRRMRSGFAPSDWASCPRFSPATSASRDRKGGCCVLGTSMQQDLCASVYGGNSRCS